MAVMFTFALALPTLLATYLAASPPPANSAPGAQPLEGRVDWQTAMHKLPLPRAGCFEATYPNHGWQAVPCVRKRPVPHAPRQETVGGTVDDTAHTASPIVKAVGTFPSITGLTSETDSLNGPNSWSLQINSSRFTTSACNGHASCQGWQQFLFDNDGAGSASIYMQYWMYGYGTCPPVTPQVQWYQSGSDCYTNSEQIQVTYERVTNLANLSLVAMANPGGLDTVEFPTDQGMSAVGEDSVLNLASAWNAAEFNIVGEGGFSEANFNPGTTITVALTLTLADGSTAAPGCSNVGYTGEINNLTLVDPCCTGSAPPRIEFTESNAANAQSPCPPPHNACGGTATLSGSPGTSCSGAVCGRWSCATADSVKCYSVTNVCGGCAEEHQLPGEGPQPGEPCPCSNGVQGHYYCSAQKALACDCAL